MTASAPLHKPVLAFMYDYVFSFKRMTGEALTRRISLPLEIIKNLKLTKMNFKVFSFLALLNNGALAVSVQDSWKPQILAKLTPLPSPFPAVSQSNNCGNSGDESCCLINGVTTSCYTTSETSTASFEYLPLANLKF